MTASRGAVPLDELVGYLDRYLDIAAVPDEPTAVNGLQVQNQGLVGSVVAAVDASQETIDELIAHLDSSAAPPLLLVHHGLLWDGNVPITDRRYRRLAALIRHDIAVYSAHIPLDLHPEIGNNVLLARELGLAELKTFDSYKGAALGILGAVDDGIDRDAFVRKVNQLLGVDARLIPGGPEMVKTVGVITGGAGSRILAAKRAGADTFLTGEGAHHTYFDAMELGLNVIYAGHYATERAGVRALAEHLSRRFELPWSFLHRPTGL